MTTIILTGSCVYASMCEQKWIWVELLLPNFNGLLEDPPTPGLVKIHSLICHIMDIYKALQEEWQDSHSGAKVCECVFLCVIVSYLCLF